MSMDTKVSVLGFEPRSPRPQRGILTTKLHRLHNLLWRNKIHRPNSAFINDFSIQIRLAPSFLAHVRARSMPMPPWASLACCRCSRASPETPMCGSYKARESPWTHTAGSTKARSLQAGRFAWVSPPTGLLPTGPLDTGVFFASTMNLDSCVHQASTYARPPKQLLGDDGLLAELGGLRGLISCRKLVPVPSRPRARKVLIPFS